MAVLLLDGKSGRQFCDHLIRHGNNVPERPAVDDGFGSRFQNFQPVKSIQNARAADQHAVVLNQRYRIFRRQPFRHGLAILVLVAERNALHLSPPEFKRCSKLLDELCRLAKKDYPRHYGDHLGLLLNILSILARNAAAKSGNKTTTSPRAVVSAIKMIDDAPREAWTLTTLAARAHIEPTYFSRLFHSAVGLPPMAYVTRRRLELATSLLRRDDLPVGEVGAMAGWEDQNYFSRCFRKHFGMTPSRYRDRFMAEAVAR